MSDSRTDEELRAAADAGEQAAQEIARRARGQADAIEARVVGVLLGDPMAAVFGADELRFAATARCHCGAGMAYPKNGGPRGAWHCSAILRGTASVCVAHTAPMGFAFYEIKSEDQPSAYGATTRDKDGDQ